MNGRSALIVTALAALAAGGPGRALEVAVREIRVERPGTVRFELGIGEIVHLGDAGALEILGPDGERVGAERRPARAQAPCRPAEIAAVERHDEGWRLELRVPAGTGRHGALDFELDEATLAPGCRLEERAPEGRWRELASGDLFRVGEAGTLARTRIAYPATAARELRLSWPASAGYPRVRSAKICAPEAPRSPLLRPARSEARAAPPGRARFALALPPRAALLAALELELPGPPAGELGWRILFGQDGRWRELAHGLWPGRRAQHRIELGDVAFAGRELLLELLGAPAGTPTATWELAPQTVRFVADRPGTWTLRVPAPGVPAAFTPAEREAEFAPGEIRFESAPWPPPRPGAPAPALAGGRRVAVATGGAEPGAPLAVELPADLLAAAGAGVSDLRLVAGGRLVPARVEEVPEPRTVETLPDLAPVRRAPGRSSIEITVRAEPSAGESVETTGLVLFADRAPRPFRRDFEVIGIGGGAGPERETRLGSRRWECSADAGDACETDLGPALLHFDRVRLEFEDGDNAPLAGLSAERFARRRQLVFQSPAASPELIVGAGARAPAYDLAPLESALALAPPAPARLGAELARATAGTERWSRPLLIAAVAGVALVLLLLLRRLLPASAGPG